MKLSLKEQEPQLIKSDNCVEVNYGVKEKHLGILYEAIGKNLYEDPVKAIIREYLSNARDECHVNNTAYSCIEVYLPTINHPQFEIQDFGRGMSPEFVKDYYVSYCSSDKNGLSSTYNDSSPDRLIGGFGFGSKTFAAYTNTFNFVTIKDGVEYSYTSYIGKDSIPKCILHNEVQTNKPNGTKVIVPVKPKDIDRFRNEIYRQCFLLKDPPTIYRGDPIETTKFEYHYPTWSLIHLDKEIYTHFFRESYYYDDNNILISNAGVPYILEKSELKNKVVDFTQKEQLISLFDRLNFKTSKEDYKVLVINFEPQELDLVPSRDGLKYSERTINNLVNRLLEVDSQVNEKIKEDVKKASSIDEALSVVYSWNNIIKGKIEVEWESPNKEIFLISNIINLKSFNTKPEELYSYTISSSSRLKLLKGMINRDQGTELHKNNIYINDIKPSYKNRIIKYIIQNKKDEQANNPNNSNIDLCHHICIIDIPRLKSLSPSLKNLVKYKAIRLSKFYNEYRETQKRRRKKSTSVNNTSSSNSSNNSKNNPLISDKDYLTELSKYGFRVYKGCSAFFNSKASDHADKISEINLKSYLNRHDKFLIIDYEGHGTINPESFVKESTSINFRNTEFTRYLQYIKEKDPNLSILTITSRNKDKGLEVLKKTLKELKETKVYKIFSLRQSYEYYFKFLSKGLLALQETFDFFQDGNGKISIYNLDYLRSLNSSRKKEIKVDFVSEVLVDLNSIEDPYILYISFLYLNVISLIISDSNIRTLIVSFKFCKDYLITEKELQELSYSDNLSNHKVIYEYLSKFYEYETGSRYDKPNQLTQDCPSCLERIRALTQMVNFKYKTFEEEIKLYKSSNPLSLTFSLETKKQFKAMYKLSDDEIDFLINVIPLDTFITE